MTSRRQPPFGHSEFIMEVRKGNVPGHKMVEIVGHAPAMGTSVQGLWGNFDNISRELLLSPSTIVCSSTNSEDLAVTGDGLRQVLINGLDADGNEQFEIIPLNGLVGLVTGKIWSAINGYLANAVGDDGDAAGDLWLGNGVITGGIPDIKYFWMGAGTNKGHTLSYTVPKGKTGFVLESSLSIGPTTANQSVLVDVCIDDGTINGILKSIEQGMGSAPIPEMSSPPIPGQTQYFWRGAVSINPTAPVSAVVEMMVIDDYQLSL